jgi:hypothetical protein
MQQENQSDLFNDPDIDPIIKNHIRSMISWAMVIVTVAVIGYVITILQIFSSREQRTVRSEGFDFSLTVGPPGVAGPILSVAIGLLINYFLFRFASQARNGLKDLNQQQLNNSFNNLKAYFMATSVITIIVFVLVLLSALVLGTGNIAK